MVEMVVIAAVDGSPLQVGNQAYFYDILEGKAVEIPVIKGRGFVIARGIDRPVITPDCIAVCCERVAKHAAQARARKETVKTISNVRTLWNKMELMLTKRC